MLLVSQSGLERSRAAQTELQLRTKKERRFLIVTSDWLDQPSKAEEEHQRMDVSLMAMRYSFKESAGKPIDFGPGGRIKGFLV